MLPPPFSFPGLPVPRQYGVQRRPGRGRLRRGAERRALLGPAVGAGRRGGGGVPGGQGQAPGAGLGQRRQPPAVEPPGRGERGAGEAERGGARGREHRRRILHQVLGTLQQRAWLVAVKPQLVRNHKRLMQKSK